MEDPEGDEEFPAQMAQYCTSVCCVSKNRIVFYTLFQKEFEFLRKFFRRNSNSF